jgi:hypothetical protein
MNDNAGLPQRLDRGWQWISRKSVDVLAGGRTVAEESDRWFLGALRGLERGAATAQGGADAIATALASRWERIRPSWARRRTPRERIAALLRAEGKRQGFDVKQEEFNEFSARVATLLELVYAGVVPLNDIAFEAAGDDSGSLDSLTTEGVARDLTREARGEVGALAPEAEQTLTPRADR